jgi:transcriptional regulator with XRE-family HTH domain
MSTEQTAELMASRFQDALGTAVERRRKELGLTQLQAAQLIGKNRGNWARLECGTHPPRCNTIAKVAVALKLSMTDLMLRAAEVERNMKPYESWTGESA